MGMGIKAMRTVFVLLAVAVTAYAVTEVQELGNTDATASNHESADLSAQDDDEGLGEGTGFGRGGAFLSTTGSFTLSSGNNFGGNEEDEDELGEGTGFGRGGAFLSTTGSFTLSSGNNFGGNEEDEDEF